MSFAGQSDSGRAIDLSSVYMAFRCFTSGNRLWLHPIQIGRVGAAGKRARLPQTEWSDFNALFCSVVSEPPLYA